MGRLTSTTYCVCLLLLSTVYSLLSSCSPSGQQGRLTREDSLRIAKIFCYEITGKANSLTNQRKAIVLNFSNFDGLKKREDMKPTSWDKITEWAANWSRDSLILDSNGKVVTGWKIDADGLNLLRDAGARYKEVYLRLGRRGNRDYTIMILPLKDAGRLYQNGNPPAGQADENYDHLDPCPGVGCPTDFDHEQ